MAKTNISDSRALDLIERAMELDDTNAREEGRLGFMPRILVQTNLPYRDPKTEVYKRYNGDVQLSLLSPNGVPFGSIPRFLVSYLATEAVKTNDRVISLGRSQAEFVKMLGMKTAGGAQTGRVKDQCRRFFTTMMSAEVNNPDLDEYALHNVLVAKKAFLFWKPNSVVPALWESTMEITQDFFDECVQHPVPIDLGVMDILSPSPMAMDVYVWLTYRVTKARKPSVLPWEYLMLQFGTKEGTAPRTFRRSFENALKQVETASNWHPSITTDDLGITIYAGKGHIPPVNKRKKSLGK